MTKKDFYKYVKSLNKEKGNYSKAELFEIGVKHQTLTKAEKNWNELASFLGLTKDGEAYRKWVLGKRYSRGMVEKNPKHLDDKTIEEVTEEDVSESLIAQQAALYKERTKTRDTYNAYRRTLRDEARIETFKEEFLSGLPSLEKLPKVELGKCNKLIPQSEMVVGFSDLHLGQEFNNSYNEYSCEIAIKRVSKYVNDIIKYCKMYNVSRLTILNLGDLVSGIIHPTLRLEQSIGITEQVMRASEILSEALNLLQSAAPEVVYRSVVDNHSRAMANLSEHIEKENFNKLIDWFIEERLKNTNIKFAHDNIDDGIGMFTLLNGKKLLFSHGHNDKKNGCFQDMAGLIRDYPDYIFMAHYHNSAEHTFQNCKVFINGSIIGTDSYAYNKRLFSEPEQKILVFSENNLIDINVNLK